MTHVTSRLSANGVLTIEAPKPQLTQMASALLRLRWVHTQPLSIWRWIQSRKMNKKRNIPNCRRSGAEFKAEKWIRKESRKLSWKNILQHKFINKNMTCKFLSYSLLALLTKFADVINIHGLCSCVSLKQQKLFTFSLIKLTFHQRQITFMISVRDFW